MNPPGIAKNTRILVIDDNRAIHDDFRKILGGRAAGSDALALAAAALFDEPETTPADEAISFEVDSAYPGHEGLERVQEALAAGRPYAMAFVDMRMPPGWDGIETIERIWAVYPDLQVVICTAFSESSWDVMIRNLGHSDRLVILKKPFDNVEAQQLAAALTEKWRLAQQTRAQLDALEEQVRARTCELESTMLDLTAAKNAAEAALRTKGLFLASMSHELRTPMNGVIGMAELLLTSPLAPDQRESAETIRDSAGNLLTILNDILDFSKIEANKLTFDVHDFELRSTVEGTLDLLAARAQSKGVELVSAIIAPDVPPHLRGDSGRLRQVITNLLGNAIKFTERGEVVLRVSVENESAETARLRFEFTDTGIGIPPAAQAGLFQAFSQADNSTTRKYGGTGLGLAICKQLVTLMRGEIGMRSTPNHGSTFWFTAQFEKQASVADAPDSNDHLPTELPAMRVLVVDDNATNNRVVRDLLEAHHHASDAAEDGHAALAALRAAVAAGRPFDCVLLDLQLPDGPGLSVSRAIKADSALAKTRVIALARSGQVLGTDQLSQAGIAAHIAKPVKQSRLLESLSRVAEIRHDGIFTSTIADVGASSALARTPASDQATISPAPVVPSRAVRILLAEDNVVNQKVALRQLRKLGYDARCVSNGTEVLAAMSEENFDLILMDCQMPELDGFDATREIRRREEIARATNPALVPVQIVAMTANAMQGDRERCLDAGMNGYLSKPAQLADLKAAVETVCLVGPLAIAGEHVASRAV
jgi:signal transduction histidine kinase/PleD family two-component response regulator